MSQHKLQEIEILFLAGMPGAILAVGGLVWWRRRK
jgi:LPXTG-motif cell wall-anchored protein